MKTYDGIAKYPERARPATVAIGNFDGLHRGHQVLVRRVVEKASDSVATIVDFRPHPRKVLQGEAPSTLATPDLKFKMLQDAGVEQLVSIHFTKSFSKMEPEEFVLDVLVGKLNVTEVIVGQGFRFGRMARGDTNLLRSMAHENGFSVETLRLVSVRGRSVSSTAIRHALRTGDVLWSRRALGRPYRLEGSVVKGAGRGSSLGFPTANLKPNRDMTVPGEGVYAGMLHAGRRKSRTAISIGTNPTFGGSAVSVEAFAIDFKADLYGAKVALDFHARLRDQRTFSSAEMLSQAMLEDVRRTRAVMRGATV